MLKLFKMHNKHVDAGGVEIPIETAQTKERKIDESHKNHFY